MYNKERWNDYYNIFQCAIKATQDAYMPNAQRKKEYLAIYADLCKENETLVKYIVQLNNKAKTAELLSATGSRPNRNAQYATAAYNRWRDASRRVSVGNGGSGGSGSSGTIVTE